MCRPGANQRRVTKSILAEAAAVLLYTPLMYFSLQQRYAHNPLSLYQTVQQCLSSEMHLVQVQYPNPPEM